MPEVGTTLNPGANGPEMRHWLTASGRRDSFTRLAVSRDGILYVSATDMISLATTAGLRVWGFFNPNGSGQNAWIRRLWAEVHATAAAGTVNLRLQRISDTGLVPAGGTLITPTRPDNGSVAGSVIVQRALPTNGTAAGGNQGSILTPTTAGVTIAKELQNSAGYMNRDLLVPPNSGILLVVNGSANANHRVQVEMVWEEAAV